MPTENEKQITAVMQVEIALDKYERWIEGNHKAEKFDLSDLQNAIKQALTTERQQLIDFYEASGKINPKTKVSNCHSISGESWYDLTFKTQ